MALGPAALKVLILAAAVGWLARFGLLHPWVVLVCVALVAVVEVWPLRGSLGRHWPRLVAPLIAGASVAVIVAVSARALSQLVVVLIYAGWRIWHGNRAETAMGFGETLGLSAVVFQAVFLGVAIWHAPSWGALVVIWLASYVLVYTALFQRGDRLARILAATWALIVIEVSAVFLTWLVTYVLASDWLIVTQPALILTGLCYCFGGIYVSQQQKSLTRGRLGEYLFIALLLVIIVISGTPWRGSL